MTASVTVRVAFAGKRLAGAAHQPSPQPAKATVSNTAPNPARVRPPAPCSRAAADRLARQLALAHLVERMIDAGEIATFAEAASRLGVMTARVSQVMDLLGLAPAVREAILMGTMPASERGLRVGRRYGRASRGTKDLPDLNPGLWRIIRLASPKSSDWQ